MPLIFKIFLYLPSKWLIVVLELLVWWDCFCSCKLVVWLTFPLLSLESLLAEVTELGGVLLSSIDWCSFFWISVGLITLLVTGILLLNSCCCWFSDILVPSVGGGLSEIWSIVVSFPDCRMLDDSELLWIVVLEGSPDNWIVDTWLMLLFQLSGLL